MTAEEARCMSRQPAVSKVNLIEPVHVYSYHGGLFYRSRHDQPHYVTSRIAFQYDCMELPLSLPALCLF
jgi:hypothetical protein